MNDARARKITRNEYLERFPYETRILLVEDTKITREIIHRMLFKLGYGNVVPAGNGEVAWSELDRSIGTDKPFGLVLADWKMPVLTGLELLERVRSHAYLKPLPFILLTTNIKQEHVLTAIQAGVTDYLAKPFALPTLERKMIQTWMKVRNSI